MTNFEKMFCGEPLDLTEIYRLDKMLTEAGIPHTLLPAFSGGMQIRVYFDEAMTHEFDDCVMDRYSHGAWDGLLETCNLNGCEGYETVEEVFKGWLAWYKER